MSRVQRNRARLGLVLLLVAIADRILPFEIFLLAAVVVLLAAAAAVSMHWYEQAVDVETENMQLRFAVIGLEDEVRDLVRDNDAMLCRLGEVLDEHALCPVPVDEIEPKPLAIGGVIPFTLIAIGGVPEQRKPGGAS